ncbi:hypothetical protein JG688_00012860 [Phytophthora aleatoria]|uniref:Uncharacterized protein n=1 Tax=Phytophthora aleatoria TaxID=2496075 RepID=A0A8J5IIM2_9STRA|nr:hypothetical protein JG688_00012860 [Phytophthora aleatoria]
MSDQHRKLWLAKASPSRSSTQKVPYADANCHYEERATSISRIFKASKVSPSPHLDLDSTVVSTQAIPLPVVPWPSQSINKERRKFSAVIQVQPGLTFRQAFGALGIPLLIVVVVCIVWTFLLIFITVAPNEAANLIMNTGDYDKGSFWLIVERPPTIKWISVAGLVLVNACYIIVLIRILRYQHTAAAICQPRRISAIVAAWDTLSSCWSLRCTSAAKTKLQNIYRIYTDLTGFNAINRKFFVSTYISRR